MERTKKALEAHSESRLLPCSEKLSIGLAMLGYLEKNNSLFDMERKKALLQRCWLRRLQFQQYCDNAMISITRRLAHIRVERFEKVKCRLARNKYRQAGVVRYMVHRCLALLFEAGNHLINGHLYLLFCLLFAIMRSLSSINARHKPKESVASHHPEQKRG